MGTETFELERFVWATPDRLEIDGRFVGLGDTPPGDPVLVLRGEDQTHRLPAVSNGAAMDDQGQWHAAFAWQEAPTAFGAVELELGDELLVALPEPGADDDESELGVLDVRRRSGAERLRLKNDLLSVRSELDEAGAVRKRLEKELARAREDLAEERAARAEDAERFRGDLGEARELAEETVAGLLGEMQPLRTRVEELEDAGGEVERLRARLTAVRAALGDEHGSQDVGAGAVSA